MSRGRVYLTLWFVALVALAAAALGEEPVPDVPVHDAAAIKESLIAQTYNLYSTSAQRGD